MALKFLEHFAGLISYSLDLNYMQKVIFGGGGDFEVKDQSSSPIQ